MLILVFTFISVLEIDWWWLLFCFYTEFFDFQTVELILILISVYWRLFVVLFVAVLCVGVNTYFWNAYVSWFSVPWSTILRSCGSEVQQCSHQHQRHIVTAGKGHQLGGYMGMLLKRMLHIWRKHLHQQQPTREVICMMFIEAIFHKPCIEEEKWGKDLGTFLCSLTSSRSYVLVYCDFFKVLGSCVFRLLQSPMFLCIITE